MKRVNKKFIIRGIKRGIDLFLILQFIVVFGTVVSTIKLSIEKQTDSIVYKELDHATMSSPFNSIMIAFSNPDLGKNIQIIDKKMDIFWDLCRLLNVIVLILITLQFKYIFKSFSLEDYFNQSNPFRIRKIAILIFIWVIVDSAIRYIPEIIIPSYFISSSIGLNSLTHGNSYGIFGFNIKMLLVSIIIYTLSIVFKYGNNLKEESSLTI